MDKIQELRAALKERFLERDHVIDGMLVALLAKETCFLLGLPGTAKSAVSEAICQSLGGGYFSWLLTKFTTPEEIFGPISLKAMDNDEYKRVTTGRLPEARVAFLDEIFKGSSAIVNTLLPILNERKFFDGVQPKNIPLEVVYAASNEIPDGVELAALYDRLVIKFEVKPLSSVGLKKLLVNKFCKKSFSNPLPQVTPKDLADARALVSAVTISEEFIETIVKILDEVNQAGIYASNRKAEQLIRIVCANAALYGRTEVCEDDLEIVAHCVWRTPDQFKQVFKIVSKFCNPIGEKILAIKDATDDVMDLNSKGKIPTVEAITKIKGAVKSAKELVASNPGNKKAKELESYCGSKFIALLKDQGVDISV